MGSCSTQRISGPIRITLCFLPPSACIGIVTPSHGSNWSALALRMKEWIPCARPSKEWDSNHSVILPGYLSEEELAALLASCKALIFPSLYEGFGMPILEAMAFSKPILCSNVTSLPEVAGDGALLFDPRRPHEILAAIEQIISDSKLASSLVERGKARIAHWGGPEKMAREYLAVFQPWR